MDGLVRFVGWTGKQFAWLWGKFDEHVVDGFVRGTGGSAMGIGAALSTTLAGYVFDAFGGAVVFIGLASIAAIGLLLVFLLMPETRPQEA